MFVHDQLTLDLFIEVKVPPIWKDMQQDTEEKDLSDAWSLFVIFIFYQVFPSSAR